MIHMEDNIKILLVDDEKPCCDALQEYFSSLDNYQVCGCADNGQQALEMIAEHEPDAVVLDLVMPHLDGIAVLEKLPELSLSNKPVVLVMTSLNQSAMTKRAMDLGADYYVRKPFNLDTLDKRIRYLRNSNVDAPALPNNRSGSLESDVTRVMHQMGVPAHVKGYQYLRDAIVLVTEEVNLIGAVTKELYPLISEKYNTTPSRVERAIRHAIELAWDRGNVELMNKYFGYTINIDRGKPTNSEFIAMVADKMRMGDRIA